MTRFSWFRSPLFSVIAITLMTACVPHSTSSDGTSLVGTEWRLVELHDAPSTKAPGERQPNIRFEEDLRLSGFTGCNNVSGRYTRQGTELGVDGPLAMTRMACLDPQLNAQEQRLAAVLEAMNRYTIAADLLTLYGPEGRLARFQAVSE